jgi:hypothetical protein
MERCNRGCLTSAEATPALSAGLSPRVEAAFGQIGLEKATLPDGIFTRAESGNYLAQEANVRAHWSQSVTAAIKHAAEAEYAKLKFTLRWNHHPHSRRDDLANVAVELGMGHRSAGGDQHVV